WYRAGIVHQDIDAGEFPRQPLDVAAIGKIRRDRLDAGVVALEQRCLGGIEVPLRACDQHEVAAFARERFRRGAADALRAAGDQRILAFEMKIHGNTSRSGKRERRDADLTPSRADLSGLPGYCRIELSS